MVDLSTCLLGGLSLMRDGASELRTLEVAGLGVGMDGEGFADVSRWCGLVGIGA